MIRRRWIVETIVSLMISAFFINVLSPSMSFAANVSENVNIIATANSQTKPDRIVVSMGDSYSSGEGIEPFFGDGSDPKKPEFIDWLAHRSQYSWPGQLKLTNTGEMKKHKASYNSKYDDSDNIRWYFVASSGAETKDILGCQTKTYTANRLFNQQQDIDLVPQINVLNELNKKGVVPDYITLTLGGNDLGFVDVITTAAAYSTYLTPYFLYNKLKEAEEKLENTTRNDINKAYHDINEAASIGDKKPYILVAGYPALLDLDGKGLPFAKWESEMIDNDVAYFNNIIEQEVSKCKGDMNIEYVHVMTKEFTKHAAYSDDPWINEIKLVRKTDLDRSKPILASAASIHPNKKGAKEYARCVQSVIDSIEKKHSSDPSDTTPSETPSTTETTVPTITTLEPLTDEQAQTAIRNYVYIELGYDQYNGEAPWYLDLDEKSNSSTAVVHLRAYTGSHSFFYIDRMSGETHEKAYPPNLTIDVDEPIDGATFNARDYLNRASVSTEPSSVTSETTSVTAIQSSKPKSTKQLAYTAYLKVLQKNKKAIKAYKRMNVFSKMKKSKDGSVGGYWFGNKPIIQKSSNKNCALCELTGDSIPELLFITANKKKFKLHAYTYNSLKKKAVEIFSLSLSLPGTTSIYLGYSIFKTKDNKLVFFHDAGLGNGDSLGDVDVYKYDGNKIKKHQSFVAAGSDQTTFSIKGKKCSYDKFKSEKQKVVKSTEQIVFYTVIYENESSKGLISRSKKLKSVGKTYDSCTKTLKG